MSRLIEPDDMDDQNPAMTGENKKEQELRVKVATFAGWIDARGGKLIHYDGISPSDWKSRGDSAIRRNLPDYPNDLNACAELKEIMNHPQRMKYVELLQREYGTYGCVFATARQRCEAFIAVMEGTK